MFGRNNPSVIRLAHGNNNSLRKTILQSNERLFHFFEDSENQQPSFEQKNLETQFSQSILRKNDYDKMIYSKQESQRKYSEIYSPPASSENEHRASRNSILISTEEPKEKDERTDRLKERLKIYGMKEKTNIKGDGNCQFAAFSDQLYGDIDHAAEIRYCCVKWLRSNKNFVLSNGAKLEDFLQSEFFPTWGDYCEYMEAEGTWGDNLTLVALAELFQTKIVIISSIKIVDGQNPCTIITPSIWNQKKVAYMSHLHELHYSSLCPDNDI